MTLEQLRIFVAVAEREHVTQAAKDLNLTQSGTSAAVSALETRYAIKLFDRVGRRIMLTQAGRLFLAEAKSVLARAAGAEKVLADLAGLERGSLAIGASQTAGNYWLPSIIHAYQARFSGISVALKIGNTQSVASDVAAGTADLGFIEGDIDDPALSVTPVADDEMVLVVAAGHPLAKGPARGISRLADARWVVREEGSGTRAILETAVAKLGVDRRKLNIALELPSNEAIRGAVEAGSGVTIISKLVVASSLKAKTLVAIDVQLPKRRFFALRHKERYFTRAEREFIAIASGKT
ncbi:LysR substrate-binding domain-containing protein [Hyphomicrobium sp.]|jgi:DNA-binding transcriptional LysR family regulator|uniref:LysR substrate-binding domain-containing protein n=1 Tax=Hyphomicrobium sp. TaxID=82 RepID=UPI002D077C01|nr:LysR substrate-binding domain-containing protein [Hyphomicrobium sp.]HVZ03875.1 LysR substrate-binding domain-containing protein [Hyphomicrobium sp.]